MKKNWQLQQIICFAWCNSLKHDEIYLYRAFCCSVTLQFMSQTWPVSCVCKIFKANGHARFFGLVRGPHVAK
jgi:hypothetical protein